MVKMFVLICVVWVEGSRHDGGETKCIMHQSQVYYANISEDAARGTTVRRVTATDLDFLILNKEITYTSTGADAKFYINRATGL